VGKNSGDFLLRIIKLSATPFQKRFHKVFDCKKLTEMFCVDEFKVSKRLYVFLNPAFLSNYALALGVFAK
jgi:hypothetical protein